MFTFEWPYIFLLLPLIFIQQKFFPGKKVNDDVMLRVPFLFRLQKLDQHTSFSILPSTLKKFYRLCLWSFLLIAAANPKWLGEPVIIPEEGRNIMLAVDLSPSMAIPDLERNNKLINRLESVKTVATQFIEKRKGDKLGLILFGSKAYIQTPLTFDRKTVETQLADATIGLAGNHTAIGDAIGLGVKKLMTENIKSRILILLTDGGNNTGLIDPTEATLLAKQNKIKIYTIGIGASEIAISNGFRTRIVNPSYDLDETLLKKVAHQTEGQYFRAEDQKALTTILESINQLEPVRSENKTARPSTHLFYWPLTCALLFLTFIIFPIYNVKKRK